MISWLANFRLISDSNLLSQSALVLYPFEIGPLLLSEHFPSFPMSYFVQYFALFSYFRLSTLLLFFSQLSSICFFLDQSSLKLFRCFFVFNSFMELYFKLVGVFRTPSFTCLVLSFTKAWVSRTLPTFLPAKFIRDCFLLFELAFPYSSQMVSRDRSVIVNSFVEKNRMA